MDLLHRQHLQVTSQDLFIESGPTHRHLIVSSFSFTIILLYILDPTFRAPTTAVFQTLQVNLDFLRSNSSMMDWFSHAMVLATDTHESYVLRRFLIIHSLGYYKVLRGQTPTTMGLAFKELRCTIGGQLSWNRPSQLGCHLRKLQLETQCQAMPRAAREPRVLESKVGGQNPRAHGAFWAVS